MNERFRNAVLVFIALAIGWLALPAPAQDAPAHGDHNPHHGGYVLMYGVDLHYEVVLLPAGGVQLWFTDAVRKDLPASIVSDVAVEIERPGAPMETLNMAINASGECWEGKAKPVKEGRANLHIAFVFRGEPAVLSIPATALQGAAPSAH